MKCVLSSRRNSLLVGLNRTGKFLQQSTSLFFSLERRAQSAEQAKGQMALKSFHSGSIHLPAAIPVAKAGISLFGFFISASLLTPCLLCCSNWFCSRRAPKGVGGCFRSAASSWTPSLRRQRAPFSIKLVAAHGSHGRHGMRSSCPGPGRSCEPAGVKAGVKEKKRGGPRMISRHGNERLMDR